MAAILFQGQPILSDYSSSFTSKFTSEKPLLATFPVLVLVVTVVHALAAVQLIHECFALLEAFLLCLVLLASVVASLVARCAVETTGNHCFTPIVRPLLLQCPEKFLLCSLVGLYRHD